MQSRIAVKQANLHNSFPLIFNFTHLDSHETYNNFICV